MRYPAVGGSSDRQDCAAECGAVGIAPLLPAKIIDKITSMLPPRIMHGRIALKDNQKFKKRCALGPTI